MRADLLPFLALAACAGSRGLLEPDPPSLDFGEVDFQQEMPEGGYGLVEVQVWNHGKAQVEPQIPGFDRSRLCMNGWTDAGAIDLGPLPPESYILLQVGVCGYQPGDRDTLVEGDIQIVSDASDPLVLLPWSFTPIRDLGDDTGP